MPKGVYERTGKTTKADIMEYVKFCFRDDIAQQLARVKQPHQLAVKLFKAETGKDIKPQTAYKQRNKWTMINGNVYKTNE